MRGHPERFAVIGSNSFTGAHFVAGALRQGADVLGISRSPEPDEAFLPYRWSPHTSFSFRQLDLNRDLDALELALREFQPEYVVNFAAQGMVAQSWTRPEHWYQTNTVAMARLHDRLRTLPSLRKFVHASTPEVYGNTVGLVSEDAPYSPSTPYAISKAACDMNLVAFVRAYRFPAVLTRSANVCGPGQALYRILPRTVLSILKGTKLPLQGGGASVRSFIHIEDVIDGTLRVAREGVPGLAYHLTTDLRQSIRDLVEEICRHLGASFEKSVEFTPGRLGQDAAYLLDCTRARAQLQWTPRHNLDNAIADTAAWVRKYWERLRDVPVEYVHKE
jgi:dTDP-glucose 4,6-dehydratase